MDTPGPNVDPPLRPLIEFIKENSKKNIANEQYGVRK